MFHFIKCFILFGNDSTHRNLILTITVSIAPAISTFTNNDKTKKFRSHKKQTKNNILPVVLHFYSEYPAGNFLKK